jgi:hypothetical protein
MMLYVKCFGKIFYIYALSILFLQVNNEREILFISHFYLETFFFFFTLIISCLKYWLKFKSNFFRIERRFVIFKL